MRIAIIMNMIAPYHAPVFEHLAARDDCEILVIYETTIEPNRQWRLPRMAYPHVVLKSASLDVSKLAVGSGTRIVSDIYIHIPSRPLRNLVSFDPDVVVAGGGTIWASPSNIAALAGRRHYGWAFVPRWETHSRKRPTIPRRLAERWVRYFFRAGDAWLAVGTRSAVDLERLGADPSRIFIWPMVSARAPHFSGTTEPGRHSTRYLFVGQLIERKGILELLDAFTRTDHGELWVAGDGPLASAVNAAVRAKGRVRWFGYANVHDLYRQVDVVVLPSRYDTWGLVVNEAIGHGLPVVTTTEVGAADDLILDGVNGRIIPPNDPEALALAMQEVGGWSQTQRADGAEASRLILAEWTFERAATTIAAACAAAVQHRSRTGPRASQQGVGPHDSSS